MNIGVFLPNWIGDVVMATPTLRALRRHYGDRATLVGVMRPYVGEVLAGAPWLDRVIYFDRKSPDRQQRVWNVVRHLRRLKLHSVLLLTNSLSGAMLAWMSGAGERIGYVCDGRSLLLTRHLHPPKQWGKRTPVSAVDYYLELAYSVGCRRGVRTLELRTLPCDERAADHVWQNLGLDSARRVVVFNTGGAFGAAKDWPDVHFAALARRIVQTTDASVLIVCGPNEREAAAEIERRAANERVRSLAHEKLGIGLSKACVRRSQLMVSTDSGPRHFAAAFNVPAVALFGPTDPRWSESYNPHEIRLWEETSCGPCRRRTCPLEHHRCMRELSVDTVFGAVRQQLGAGEGTTNMEPAGRGLRNPA